MEGSSIFVPASRMSLFRAVRHGDGVATFAYRVDQGKHGVEADCNATVYAWLRGREKNRMPISRVLRVHFCYMDVFTATL